MKEDFDFLINGLIFTSIIVFAVFIIYFISNEIIQKESNETYIIQKVEFQESQDYYSERYKFTYIDELLTERNVYLHPSEIEISDEITYPFKLTITKQKGKLRWFNKRGIIEPISTNWPVDKVKKWKIKKT